MPTPSSWSDAISVSLTGSTNIDALLGGTRWASSNISYSFPDPGFWATSSITGYGPSSGDQEPWSLSFKPLFAADQTYFSDALQEWANVANLQFSLVADTSTNVGDIRAAYTDGSIQDGAPAWAYLPSDTSSGGDVWFDRFGTNYTEPWTPGSYEYETVLHELGHALGLKHPFSGPTVLPSSLDSRSFTIMSYSAEAGDQSTGFSFEPTTPMVLDIAAMQYLYGANNSYHAGNDTYVYSDSTEYHETIWDGGGTDTIQYSGSLNSTIDLRSGVTYGSQIGLPIFVTSGGINLHEVDNVWIADGAVIENATGGNGSDFIYGNDVANLLQGGGGNDSIYGFAGDDEIAGGDGTDHLEGGAGNDRFDWDFASRAGADTFLGGAGDDVYVISGNDQVVENSAEGTDLVWASANFSIEFVLNVENLSLFLTDPVSATGNSLDNIIIGNLAANILNGGDGNDTLDGGIGTDTLAGGTGNDTYLVDNVSDVVTELVNEGTDTVQSTVTYALGVNLEHLTLTGIGAISGTGNTLDNTLTGNSGNNALNGGAGADTMLGGAGNDVYTVDHVGDIVVEQANEGVDLVSSSLTYTLGANLENLTLTGAAATTATGNALNNILTGNSAANVLTGGAGNDTYYAGVGDTMVENVNEGTDLVYSTISWTLGANIENLTLYGSAAVNGTGNSLNNTLTGNSAANVLTGATGDDTYVVGAGDTVVENANEGVDLVSSSLTYTLGANLEKLTLTGSGVINGTGNELSNILTGNSAANVLTGGAGNDTYYAGVGDTMVENVNEGTDLVYSTIAWTLGANIENLTLYGSAAVNGTGNSLNNTLTGNSAANVFTGGTGDDIYIVGAGDTVVEQANEGVDLVQSAVSWTLGANLEKLTLTGTGAINGTGNSLSNTLTGNSATNVLTGGVGNDIYYAGVGDTMVENVNEGTDLVYSTIAWTLGANIENLTLYGSAAVNGTGNSLNNTLTGNSAANVLTGGTGDDTYVVGAGDTVVENANEGVDLVSSSLTYTLGANLEKLTLTGTAAINGTGNSVNNTLTGNSAANVLTGGAGDDIYVVSAGDTVVEQANEGVDLVQSAVSWTLGANLEKLTLTGTGAVNGTGNSLNNILTGNSAANVLTGGMGNDIYYAGVGDTMVEAVNEGTDLVYSTIAWTLGANLENLTLYGTGAVNGTGNSLNNTLAGNSAANVLTGGTGNDTLSGGLGNDTYRVDRGEGQDRISENDGTVGNSDRLLYGATINPLDLVLSQLANDLRIAIHGSTDYVTIQNWYSAPTTAQVETIQAGNGQTLLSTQVDQLIQAMAGFTQQTGLTWDQAIDQQPQNVQTVLAASWQ